MTEVRHVGSSDCAWDFYGCDPAAYEPEDLETLLMGDIRDAGFTVINHVYYRFPGGPPSLLVIIGESHIAIHYAPENYGLLEITIHTCNILGVPAVKTPEQKTEDLLNRWKARFNPTNVVAFPTRVRGTDGAVLAREAA